MFKKIMIFLSFLLVTIVSAQNNHAPAKANTTVCYPYVGCFSNNFPFNNTNLYVPDDPSFIQTEFMLFTRQNRDTEQLLTYKNPGSIRNSNFNRNLAVKLIVHGFGNGRDKPWLHEMKNSFLDIENLNVIIVAWGRGAEFPYYNNAATNIRIVGKEISLLMNLIQELYYSLEPHLFRIHCVGHSLGAHTCGHAGTNSQVRFDRITGLDPANQFFENINELVRLDQTDAKYVDAIHTNAGLLLTGSFGITMPVGDIDFYVNGGSFQSGCPALTSIISSVISGTVDPSSDIGCSHNRAQSYFIESLKTQCSFTAFKCTNYELYQSGKCMSCDSDKCSVLGYYADGFVGTGKFYLATASEFPYCGDQYMFEMKLSGDSPKTAGEISLDLDKETQNSYSVKITNINDDIKPSTSINKFFVSRKSIFEANKIEIKFSKKPAPSWWKDPNAKMFSYNRIRLTNIETGEIQSQCFDNNTVIEDGEVKEIKLNYQDNDEDECN